METITTAIFGTSDNENFAACEYAAKIARIITQGGYQVMTGGVNRGTMKTAMEAADFEAKKLNRKDLIPIGHAMQHWGVCEIGEIIIHPTYMKRIGAFITS